MGQRHGTGSEALLLLFLDSHRERGVAVLTAVGERGRRRCGAARPCTQAVVWSWLVLSHLVCKALPL